MNYPEVRVSAHNFVVKAGHDEWLRFAQEAGFTLVLRALEAVQHRKEDEHA